MVINGAFGPWCPDLPALNNPGVTMARNVTPGIGTQPGTVTYHPMRGLSLYSDTKLDSRPLGTLVGRDKSSLAKIYAGTKNSLFKVNANDLQWKNISATGGYSTADGERWVFAEFGDIVAAFNYSNEPQYIQKSQDIKFDRLTSLVRARHCAVVRDFMVVANTLDALDGQVPYRVRWSAVNNPFDWNFSQQTMSDFQDIFNGGNIMGIVGGEAGYILMERSIVKMSFMGAPLIFQFDQLPSAMGKGCSVAESIITVEGKTFFLSVDGFYVLEGDQIRPIGDGQINRYFLNNVDDARYQYMTVASDPAKKLVYWSYLSKGASGEEADKILIYNYQTGNWSEAEATAGYIFNSLSLPWTIEQLDVYGTIENVPAPFDSPMWAGGDAMLWAMDKTGKIFIFGGSTMRGLIETQEQYLAQAMPDAAGERTNINRVRPLFHGDGLVQVRGGHRTNVYDALTYTESVPVNKQSGWAYFRYQNKFHRFRFSFEGEWSDAMGYHIEAYPAGGR